MTRFRFSCLRCSSRSPCMLLLLLPLLLLSITTVPSCGALEPEELLRFGEAAGDQRLVPGSDSTAELQLRTPVFFFKKTFNKVHINTNGFVSFAKPPAEEVYLGKMPVEFQMIAALLGDLDNSAGQGAVYFRQDNGSDVLSRVSELVEQAFPRETVDEPQDTTVVTWENMSARGGASGRGDGLDAKGNTFQLIVAAMKSASYAILLYPKDGLKFVHTSVGGKEKILESGFNQGLVQGWFWKTEQGTYYRITTDEDTSIWDLTEKTTTGKKGVLVYEIGSSPFFSSITPGTVTEVSEEREDATERPVTMLPRQTDEEDAVFTTNRPQEETTEDDKFTTETTSATPTDYTAGFLGGRTTTSVFTEMKTREQDFDESVQVETEYPESMSAPTPTYTHPELGQTSKPTPSEPQYLDEMKTTYPVFQPSQSIRTVPETSELPETPETRFSPATTRFPESDPIEPHYTPEPMLSPATTRFPESDPIEPHYTPEPRLSPIAPGFPESDPVEVHYTSPDQVQQVPPYSRSHQPQIVVVDEDEDLNVDVFSYNSETCAHNRHRCSAFADCRDYANGYCCHCRPGFYGNGKDCVAEGKPQRMNGKVTGHVFVGNSPTAMNLTNHDLHSYVVANDGRAYVAISSINRNLGPSLQPLSSLGGVIGWAFALEQPGYQNGFSIVGGVFLRQAEVIFYPGSERLRIKQQFKGIDEHDHLVVSTELEGRVPAIPLGSSVQISPYKEIYHYDRNLITSSSNRDYTITSPEGIVETRSYQWRQTITFESCSHEEATRGAPATQQLSVDQIFVMFDADNDLIRFAMSNKIGSVHSTLPEQNPCFTGRHSCDINAACRAGEGLQFACECANGFAGDGHYCYDIDECQENVCGVNAICSNQPGTFRCECLSGHVFASDGKTCIEESRPVDHCQAGSHDCDIPQRAYCSYSGGSAFVCSCLPGFVGDGRVCQDVDECTQEPCHGHAHCSNTPGSFSCQCLPGFQGDGFHCTVAEREKTACEQHREHAQAAASSSGSGIFSFFRPRPAVGHYVPQCDQHGAYESTQCHASIDQCWCVDAEGQEVPNTRTGPGSVPLCIDQTVTPSPVGPTPRPDLRPVPPGTHLLFAQSGRIEHVPLDGYTMRKDEAKPLLHIPDRVVIAVAYDCVDKMVYWSDITGPAISRASLSGGDISHIITKDLESPEGIAIDHVSRLLFWTDSMRDTVEVSKLDGSHRRVLFDTDLVNPRAIVANPVYGRIYWADWNRDGPKIEMSNMDGTDRVVLVKDDLGLPNGLSFDQNSQQLCWADAGTRKVECMDPYRMVRKTIVDGIHYPFGLVSFGRNLYYTDWRREAVVAVDLQSQLETEDFLPQKRSRLYGITTTDTQCPQAYNYCADNGGCSHLCLPRLGGATCRCPDGANDWCEEGRSQ